MAMTPKAIFREIKQPFPALCLIRTVHQCIHLPVLVRGLQVPNHRTATTTTTTATTAADDARLFPSGIAYRFRYT